MTGLVFQSNNPALGLFRNLLRWLFFILIQVEGVYHLSKMTQGRLTIRMNKYHFESFHEILRAFMRLP